VGSREKCSVAGVEAIGPYTLLRVRRGRLEPGVPGQFFMLEAPGRLLPRPMSLSLAPPGELAFLIDAIGPGTRALCTLEPGDRISIFGPLGNGYRLDVERPLLVGGGIGIAPLAYVSEALDGPPAILGFRTADHAEAAVLLSILIDFIPRCSKSLQRRHQCDPAVTQTPDSLESILVSVRGDPDRYPRLLRRMRQYSDII